MFSNEYDKTHAPKLIFWPYTLDCASSDLCCDSILYACKCVPTGIHERAYE